MTVQDLASFPVTIHLKNKKVNFQSEHLRWSQQRIKKQIRYDIFYESLENYFPYDIYRHSFYDFVNKSVSQQLTNFTLT